MTSTKKIMTLNDRIKTILETQLAKSPDNDVFLNSVQQKHYKARLKEELWITLNQALQEMEEGGLKLKILFLEYDFVYDNYEGERQTCLCGFGDGAFEYPILEEPKYIEYNYRVEFFNGFGRISYDVEINTEDETKEPDILQMDIWQVYLVLHEVFCELDAENRIDKSKMEQDVYVYANQHDMEASNLFVISH